MSTLPTYWTQQQAADYLGCIPRTVRNLISRGELVGYKIRGVRAVRVKADDVRELVQRIPAVSRRSRPMYGPKAVIREVSVPAYADPEDQARVDAHLAQLRAADGQREVEAGQTKAGIER